jgi:hypothetical protein
MFSKQAMRLLRTTWRDVNMLAQELFSMFQKDIPLEHSGPVKLNGEPGRPALTIDQSGGDFSDTPAIRINRGRDESPADIGADDEGLVFRAPDFKFVYDDGRERKLDDPGEGGEEEKEPKDGVFLGQVASAIGSTTWTMRAFLDGPNAQPVTISARVYGVRESPEGIVGSWLPVHYWEDEEGNRTYFVIPPVWL